MTVSKTDNKCHNLVHFPIKSEKSNQGGMSSVIKKIAKLAFIALAAAFSAAALAGIAFFASSTVVIAIPFAVIGAALGGATAFFLVKEKPKVKKENVVLTENLKPTLSNAIAPAKQIHLIDKGLINQSSQEKLKAYKNFVTEIFLTIEKMDYKEEEKPDLKKEAIQREAMHLIKKELASVIFAAYKKENSQSQLDSHNRLTFTINKNAILRRNLVN